VNGQTLVWFAPNPYEHGRKPYLVTSLFPVPGQLYGMSLVRHAIPSAAVIDTAVDKLLKIASLAADPIFEVDIAEPTFKHSKVIKPGMTFPVKRPGAIRQVPVNIANLQGLITIIERAEENIQQVTGASPILSGDAPRAPGNITAFQVEQHVQGANNRFQSMM